MRRLRAAAVLLASLALAAQLVLVVPAAGPAGLGGASRAAAAQLDPPAAGLALRTAEADGCTVTTGSTGGQLTSCPDVASYGALIDGLSLAFEALRAQNDTSPLSVSSDPAGATVFVDGTQLGVTPLQTSVSAGAHLVELRKDGYADFSHTVTSAAGTPTEVAKQLEAVGGQGSYKPVLASTLVGLLGSDGFADGDLFVNQLVRDRDGNYYVAFTNEKELDFSRDGWPKSNTTWIPPSVTNFETASGVAESSDNGATWRLVGKWRDHNSLRLYESRQFDDGSWKEGKPGCIGAPCDEVDHHWVKLIYSEKTTEWYEILNLIPRADSGISIQVRKHTSSNHYIATIYDNLPAGWCREDDPDHNDGTGCAPNPNLHFSNSRYVFYDYLKHDDATDRYAYLETRYGLSEDDLDEHATSDDVLIQAESIGGEAQVAGWPTTDDKPVGQAYSREAGFWQYLDSIDHLSRGLTYIGRHEDPDTKVATDYFLEYSWQTSEFDCTQPISFACHFSHVPAYGTIVTSTDGGRSLQVAMHFEDPYGAVNDTPVARLGPDGTVYLQAGDGTISVLVPGGGTATLRRLSGTVSIGQSGPGAFKIDDAGNAHLAWPNATGSGVEVWYQFVPKDPVASDGVQLTTTDGCDACASAAAYLQRAGVAFATASAKPGAAPKDDYPILTYRRDGTAQTLTQATPTAIAQALGLSTAVLVETRPIFKLPDPVRLSDGNAADIDTSTAADWVDLELDGDGPHIVLEHPDGVVALTPVKGQWTTTPLTASPTHGPDIIYRSPGGVLAGGPSHRPRKLPFLPYNGTGPRPDGQGSYPYAFLYNSDLATGPALGAGYTQQNYQLWTTEEGPAVTSFQATAQVSQLIPAATVYVGLGRDGSPGAVGGDLAGYVAAQGVVADNGDRFARITLDLRTGHATTRDGQLTPRTISGWIDVTATDDTGAPESRRVTLSLYVLNTPLAAFDPAVPGQARDVTVEAVHFTGDNERWVVTNNSALPDSVPCGPDQALYLDPNSVATYAAAVVASWELGSCLDQLEVAPTVLADCTSWADAQVLLAGETMASLQSSLRVEAIEDTTNYELALGSKDATVYRVVSLADASGAATCGGDVGDATAVVVKISGRILGGDEQFSPTVTITDRGAQAVKTASVAEPRDIAWERGWLEFEGNFLQTQLRLSVGNEALAAVVFGTRLGRRIAYQQQLLAVEALHHCNVEGVGMADVLALVDRTGAEPAALQRATACLTDFVANPSKHWSQYDKRLWAGGPFEADFLGSVIDRALAANPTLGFLAAAGRGDPVDYTPFVIGRIARLEQQLVGADDITTALLTDFELDHYARLETATIAELTDGTGGLTRALVLASDVERLGVRLVGQCATGLGGANPFAKLLELTSKRSYTAGIPCVDAAGSSGGKIEAYQRLAIALRSGTVGAIVDMAGRDSDLLASLFAQSTTIIAAIQAAEARYPAGAPISAWQADQPPLDRFVILARQVAAIGAARGRQMTLAEAGEVLSGASQCGTGLVTGLVGTYGEGLALLGLGAGAAIAGPVAAAGSGLIFLGSGTVFTKLAADDLSARWDQLDLTQKSAGLCSTAASALMTLGAAPGASKVLQLTKAELAFSPPKVIDIQALVRRGKGVGQPIKDQAATMKARRGALEAPATEPAIAPDVSLRKVLNALPRAKAAQVQAAALRLRYAGMSVEWRSAFDSLATAYGETGGLAKANALRQASIEDVLRESSVSPEVLAPWIEMGSALIWELTPGRPKSLAVTVRITDGPGGARAALVGPDAGIVSAALDDGFAPTMISAVARGIGDEEARADALLLRAVLSSERTTAWLNAGSTTALFTAEETAAIVRLRAARWPDAPSVFAREILDGTRAMAAIREGVTTGRAFVKASAAPIAGVEVSSAGQGLFKNAFRMTLRLADGRTFDVAVKKGRYSPDEFDAMVTLSGKGLMQHPFIKTLVEGVNGANESLSVEEFVAGRKPSGSSADGAAIGRFEARLYLRTGPQTGPTVGAWFNTDLHSGNMLMVEVGGRVEAVCIDFDPQFQHDLTADQYWGASILRRFGSPLFLLQQTAYLDGVLAGFAEEPGSSRAAAITQLKRTAAQLRDPTFVAGLGSFVSTLGDASISATTAADALDRYLAAKGSTGAILPLQPTSVGWAAVGLAA